VKSLASSDENSADRATPASAVLEPVLDFLRRHAPFDQMAPAHLELFAKRLKLGFYAQGSIITEPGAGAAQRFYVIKQGRVRGETATGTSVSRGPRLDPIGETETERGPSEDGAWELVPGECFPIGALLARRPVRTVHRAVEDTFCFELERDEFDKLLVLSPVFHDFCSRRLANLLDQALRSVQVNTASQMSGDASLNAPLRGLVRREPVTCRITTPIREALRTMNAARVGSIVVTDDDRRPLGIFTLHDLLGRVATADIDPGLSIDHVMTADPFSLAPRASAHEAALVMARQGVGHLCVVEDGRLVGVVSERDLFSLQRIGLVNLSRAITNAQDIEALARLGQDIHRLVDQMLAQGASVAQISQIITLLDDHIAQRVVTLTLAETGMPSVAFTWLAFGSEGRQEQTLKTDQDNGILFLARPGKTTEAARAELLPIARRVNEALAQCGFPLCPGNVMASNPECCLSFEEWRNRFTRWIDQGTPEHLLKASIYFDFRPLYGETAEVAELRTWLTERVHANSRFRLQMAANALRNRPPLGLFGDFKVSSGRGRHPHSLNLKIQGVTPFVDGARILAFANRVTATNTIARLRDSAHAGGIGSDDADTWIEAYEYIQLLRMRGHHDQAERGERLSNYFDPDTLNDLNQRVLKESFRQARRLQSKVALDYQLGRNARKERRSPARRAPHSPRVL
jgi:CBS domain-containing protein